MATTSNIDGESANWTKAEVEDQFSLDEDDDLEVDQSLPYKHGGQCGDGNAGEGNLTSTHRLHRTPNAIRKRNRDDDITGAIRAMLDVSRARHDLLISYLSPSPRAVSTDYTVAQCITVLEGMPDLDKDLYMKAVMKMVDNPQWREVFIILPPEKKMWLLEKID